MQPIEEHVQFDEELQQQEFKDIEERRLLTAGDRRPLMTKILMKMRVTKNERQANRLLVGIIVVFFIIAGYLFWQVYTSKNHSNMVIDQHGNKVTVEQYLQENQH